MDSAWWLILVPGITLTLCLLCMNFLGDSLRDALDPTAKINRSESGFLFFGLFRGLDSDADFLGNTFDVLQDLPGTGAGAFVPAFEFLVFFLEKTDFIFQGLNAAHEGHLRLKEIEKSPY
jgi:hypothetical protein